MLQPLQNAFSQQSPAARLRCVPTASATTTIDVVRIDSGNLNVRLGSATAQLLGTMRDGTAALGCHQPCLKPTLGTESAKERLQRIKKPLRRASMP